MLYLQTHSHQTPNLPWP